MSGSTDRLSTQEFAKKAGVSPNTVSKWLRAGKISGEKTGGKWMISSAEIGKIDSPKPEAAEKPTVPASSNPTKIQTPDNGGGKTFSIQEFSKMTYLTEYGVKKLLKEGRLLSAVDGSGQMMVDSASLERPDIKRLVR